MGRLDILSRSGEPFRNRDEAGRMLAVQLSRYKGRDVVVLGILRGGIVVAREIAVALGADLDIVLSRKIGAPGHAELAIGAVAESGRVFVNEAIASHTGAGGEYIEREKERQVREIERRVEMFRDGLPKVDLTGKTAIVTDDGIATGATMTASLWSLRQEGPEELIAAVPVASEDRLRNIAEDADETICLRAPDEFFAVGQFYEDFRQIDDEEVRMILKEYVKGPSRE